MARTAVDEEWDRLAIRVVPQGRENDSVERKKKGKDTEKSKV